MRTTLTLDDALAAQLKQVAHSRQISFKEAVNEALGLGLRQIQQPAEPEPYRTTPRHLGAFRGVDPARLGQIDDEVGDLHRMGLHDSR